MHNGNEIEFEYVPGMNGGALQARGNVVTTLRDMLSSGRIEEATELYAGCADRVGDEVLESLAVGASRELVTRFAEMLAGAGDFRRAAVCAQRAGDEARAQRYLESAYVAQQTAEKRLREGIAGKAAEAAEAAGDFLKAASLYLELNAPVAAAEALERGGQFLSAGKLFTQAGRWDRAVASLSKVGARTDDFVQAGWLLGNIYERSGQPDVAVNYYLCVLKQRSLGEETRELAVRLASLLRASGRPADAERLEQRVRHLDGGTRGASEPAAPETPIELVQVSAAAVRAVDSAAVAAPLAEDRDLPLLDAAQLFSDLSPSERDALRPLGERVVLQPGAALTQVGAPSAALFVIVRGQVQLVGRNMDDERFPLGTLGPGQHTGELALLDGGPCAFDTIAERTVVAYRFEVGALRQLMERQPQLGLNLYRAVACELAERFRTLRRWLPATRITRTAQVPSVPRS